MQQAAAYLAGMGGQIPGPLGIAMGRIVNNTFEKYCQYQYQYFLTILFFASHYINAINNSNCNPNPNLTHTTDAITLTIDMPYLSIFYILEIRF